MSFSVPASSSSKRRITFSFWPTNLEGQWHSSQVSRAGRSAWTGVGMGRGYRSSATDTSCQLPESFDFTNQLAPEPMWHSTQATRACGERPWAVTSGSITLWHEPQNWGRSMSSIPA